MKKIKIYNDGTMPKLGIRILIMQISCIILYYFFRNIDPYMAAAIGVVAISMPIGFLIFED